MFEAANPCKSSSRIARSAFKKSILFIPPEKLLIFLTKNNKLDPSSVHEETFLKLVPRPESNNPPVVPNKLSSIPPNEALMISERSAYAKTLYNIETFGSLRSSLPDVISFKASNISPEMSNNPESKVFLKKLMR